MVVLCLFTDVKESSTHLLVRDNFIFRPPVVTRIRYIAKKKTRRQGPLLSTHHVVKRRDNNGSETLDSDFQSSVLCVSTDKFSFFEHSLSEKASAVGLTPPFCCGEIAPWKVVQVACATFR